MITKAKRACGAQPHEQWILIRRAIDQLKGARDDLRDAGSKNAADYVARALKSAEGALRHADRGVGDLSGAAGRERVS